MLKAVAAQTTTNTFSNLFKDELLNEELPYNATAREVQAEIDRLTFQINIQTDPETSLRMQELAVALKENLLNDNARQEYIKELVKDGVITQEEVDEAKGVKVEEKEGKAVRGANVIDFTAKEKEIEAKKEGPKLIDYSEFSSNISSVYDTELGRKLMKQAEINQILTGHNASPALTMMMKQAKSRAIIAEGMLQSRAKANNEGTNIIEFSSIPFRRLHIAPAIMAVSTEGTAQALKVPYVAITAELSSYRFEEQPSELRNAA